MPKNPEGFDVKVGSTVGSIVGAKVGGDVGLGEGDKVVAAARIVK